MTAPSCPDKYAGHTPGPWGRDSDGGIRSMHTEANGYASEYVASLDHYRDDRLAERDANARLIADAPTLLAKLLAAEAELSRAREVIAAVGPLLDRFAVHEMHSGKHLIVQMPDGSGAAFRDPPYEGETVRGEVIGMLIPFVEPALAAYSTARQTEK